MVVRGPAYLWKMAGSGSVVMPFPEAFELVRRELTSAACSGVDCEQGTTSPAADKLSAVRMTQDARMEGVPAAVPQPKAAEISAAHLAMLEDPMLKETVEAELAAGKSEPEALDAACSSICAMFSDIDDEYLRARVDDVRDVFRRLKDAICENGRGSRGAQRAKAGSAAKPIIVAEELFPSDIAAMDLSSIAGILCARGSSTSHVSIIAHANGTPIQFGADISQIAAGDIVTVDDPMVGPSSIAAQVRAAGRKLYVNAGSVEDIRAAMAAGADI